MSPSSNSGTLHLLECWPPLIFTQTERSVVREVLNVYDICV